MIKLFIGIDEMIMMKYFILEWESHLDLLKNLIEKIIIGII
jgi:hypothetical protein